MVLNSGADAISISEGMAVQSTPEVLQAAMVMFATIPIICVCTRSYRNTLSKV